MFKTQIGKSLTRDLKENTWTFEMGENFKPRAGHFAIVPLDDFQELKRALTSCKMSLQAHPDNTTDSEFEGFVSLADEILNKIES
jgi:hypothetical protein